MYKRILMCFLMSSPVAADEVDDLFQLLAGTQHLSAAFEQRQFDETGILIDESAGRLALQKPNLVRWHILDPFEQLLLGDGSWLWQHDIELEQVVRRPYPEDASQTPLLIFTESLSSLRDNYTVSSQSDGCFSLRPRDEGGLFANMTLCFKNGFMTSFSLLDGFGQRTDVVLTDFDQENLDPLLFTFDLPGEAELILDDGYVR